MDKLPAALLLAVCVLLLLRMVLPARLRARVDAQARRAGAALRALPGWRQRRRSAHSEAQSAIDRARQRGKVHWQGNVARPDRFDGDRRNLH